MSVHSTSSDAVDTSARKAVVVFSGGQDSTTCLIRRWRITMKFMPSPLTMVSAIVRRSPWLRRLRVSWG